MSHAGVYAELVDQGTIRNNITGETMLRKYIYIYGGFSLECTTACYDTWRYEISYGPLALYPKTILQNQLPGNYWEK